MFGRNHISIGYGKRKICSSSGKHDETELLIVVRIPTFNNTKAGCGNAKKGRIVEQGSMVVLL
jgi:hypothetical protein